MSDISDNEVTAVGGPPMSDAKVIKEASRENIAHAHSTLVVANAIQLGVDIVRELMDTGNLENQVQNNDVSMVGVTSLIASTINREIRNKRILESIK